MRADLAPHVGLYYLTSDSPIGEVLNYTLHTLGGCEVEQFINLPEPGNSLLYYVQGFDQIFRGVSPDGDDVVPELPCLQ